MAEDKKRAIKNHFRLSEKTFFLLAIFGSGIAIFLSSVLLRHKTRKKYFQNFILTSIIINILCVIGIFYSFN